MSSGSSGNTAARTVPRSSLKERKAQLRDIEDLIRNEAPQGVPDRTHAALSYEMDPLNNRIVPRPLLGGVGRRGKLYELSQTVEVVLGTTGNGYVVFNPDVGMTDSNGVSIPHGPYSDRNVVMVSKSTFGTDQFPTGNSILATETALPWTGSKYTTSSGHKMQWQCVGYGLRIVRETAALSQNGNIVLYRSYNNANMGGYRIADFTANKSHKLIPGADLAMGSREIILSGTPCKAQWQNSSGVISSMSSLDWHYSAQPSSGIPIRSGLMAWFTGTALDKFRVELVAGYMLIGQSIQPKVRFATSPREASLLANARLSIVRPGRTTTPEETRKGVSAVLKHAVHEEEDPEHGIYDTFKGVTGSLIKDAAKIGGEIFNGLLK